SGDVTAQLVPPDQRVRGRIITREDAIVCGRPWVDETFRQLDADIRLEWHAADTERSAAGQELVHIQGRARAVLSGERKALNFLQLLSATAPAARRRVDAVACTVCTILCAPNC